MEKPIHLFQLGSARPPRGFRNPGTPATIQYWVGRPGRAARVAITDAQGAVVQEVRGPAEYGFQSVTWVPASGSETGTYTVTVSVGEASAEGTLTVVR